MTTTDIYANNPFNPFDAPVSSSTGSSTPKVTDNAEASKDMFLKLLVAQLSHQDPENPADGTAFVTQLAQFTTLEQSTQMSQDLSAIRAALTAPTTSSSGSSTDTTGTTKS